MNIGGNREAGHVGARSVSTCESKAASRLQVASSFSKSFAVRTALRTKCFSRWRPWQYVIYHYTGR